MNSLFYIDLDLFSKSNMLKNIIYASSLFKNQRVDYFQQLKLCLILQPIYLI